MNGCASCDAWKKQCDTLADRLEQARGLLERGEEITRGPELNEDDLDEWRAAVERHILAAHPVSTECTCAETGEPYFHLPTCPLALPEKRHEPA